MARYSIPILLLLIAFFVLYARSPAGAQTGDRAQLTILDRRGEPTAQITDGDLVRLRLDLPQQAGQSTPVVFSLDGPDVVVAGCTIPAGSRRCESEPFASLGWHWSAGAPAANRNVQALVQGGALLASAPLQVAARPVVMVHGFSSSWQAWQNYLGPDGFLAAIGVPGFAAGDGQVAGVMNTGDLVYPVERTNTIAQNADILGEYIANVKRATGAEQVDLLAHSMGGLISRYYLDRVMQERDVAQLLMLGSPAAGTDCANLPAALGFYLPATLEIRPSYAHEIFNRQIIHRRGVPFYALAGTSISNPIGSPCAGVPSDAVIARQSVSAVPLHLSEIDLLHTDLNASPQAFNDFVAPLLQKGTGEFRDEPDPQLPETAVAPLQFSRVFSGNVAPGQSQELTIPVDPGIAVASFALYDPSLSLRLTVRGASGNVINLDPSQHGVVVVDDPESLLHLGYGFANPNPGAWVVTLAAGDRTPPGGAAYALAAQFTGGAVLQTASSSLLPALGETVQLTARLELDGQPLPVETAVALVRRPDGAQESVPLLSDGVLYRANWEPPSPGLYGVDVRVRGRAPDGSPVERTAFLALEVQPADQVRLLAWLVVLALGLLAMFVVGTGVATWLARRALR